MKQIVKIPVADCDLINFGKSIARFTTVNVLGSKKEGEFTTFELLIEDIGHLYLIGQFVGLFYGMDTIKKEGGITNVLQPPATTPLSPYTSDVNEENELLNQSIGGLSK